MSKQCRDEKGRFCKCENKCENEGFTIKVPCHEYLPFCFILALFIALLIPWLFAAPGILKKVILTMGLSMLESVNGTKVGGTGAGAGGSS